MSVGTLGDVYPFVAIGASLADRGHEVAMATSGQGEAHVRSLGLAFHCLWTQAELDQAFRHPDFYDPIKGPRLAWSEMGAPAMRRTYALIEQAVASRHCAVVASWTLFGARLANERLGVPLCTVYQSPATLEACDPDNRRRPTWMLRSANAMFQPELNQLRRELGLTPVERICDHWMHSPQCGIGLFPSWFGQPQPYWPPWVRATGFPAFDGGPLNRMPMMASEFLRAGERPLVFCATSEARDARHFFEVAVEATLTLGSRAILLTRHAEQIPARLPPTVVHVDYAPLGELLAHAAAFVHFGGIGACAQAMRCATPQLLVPMAYDQFDNGRRVESLGIGLQIGRERFGCPAVVSAIRQLLSSTTMRARVAEVAQRFVGCNPLDDICEIIESMA